MASFTLRSFRFRLAVAASAALLAGVAALPARPSAAQHASPPQSIPTEFQRKPSFQIPFTVPVEQQNDPGTEVRLYASLDRGRTWQYVTKSPPTAKAFAVKLSETARDGEYLFALRQTSTTYREPPNEQYVPNYRAILDTQPPKVELYARRLSNGAVMANWRITDTYLDRESFQLTTGPENAMQPVALEPPRGITDPTTLAGSTSWVPPRDATAILVRARVVDRAGNPAVTTVQVNLPADAAPPPSAADSKMVDSVANARRYEAPANNALPTTIGDAQPNYTRAASLPHEGANVGRDANAAGRDFPGPNQFELPKPLDPRYRAGTGERQDWDDAESTGQTLRQREEQGPTIQNRPRGDHPPLHQPSNSLAEEPAEELPAPSTVRPPVTRQVAPPDAESQPPANVDMPPGERPRVLGSRRITLQYDVDSVGPSGVAEVELWSTTDGGRTWESLGIDPDNRSPFTATLAGEGLYGFRLVVRNGNRVGGRAPAPGDLPEMWVAVDETKPVAAITAADLRATDTGRELVIRYEAADARLAARPVALFYADKPSGPWQTIAVGLANTGGHAWPIDRQLGDRIYLRLEVRDEAGNVGAFETANAILLDESEPVGRIRSVDSPRGASVQGQWPRYR